MGMQAFLINGLQGLERIQGLERLDGLGGFYLRLAAVLLFLGPLVLCAVYDLETHTVPDFFVLLLIAGGTGCFALLGARMMAVSAVCAAVFFALAVATQRLWKKWLGGADIKIMAVMILCTGPLQAFTAAAAAFLTAGLFSAGLVLIRLAVSVKAKRAPPAGQRKRTGRAGRLSLSRIAEIRGFPFVPFLLAGVCMCLCGEFGV